MKQVVIYTRISEDRESRRLGTARQEEDCNHLAERLDLKVARVYSDNDTTAAGERKPRPDYDRMIAEAQTGNIDTIIAYSTSRLTRRIREHEDLIDLAVKHGVKFYFVASPAFDLNTADGREMARNLAAKDTGEVDRLRERIVRKKLQDAEDGKYPGGRRCYGIGSIIGVNPADGKEVRDWTKLDDNEVDVLRDMSDRILQGESQMAVVRDFNQRGITTSLGYPWTVGKLKRTMLNPSYVVFDSDDPTKRGTRLHKGARHRAIWPGIFTQVEHDAMVSCFNNNPDSWQQGKVIARSYLLSGIAVCGKCGGLMYGQGKTERGKRTRKYHCKKYNNRGEIVGCSGVFRIAEPVERLVSEAVLYRFDTPEVAAALAPSDDKQRVQELTQQYLELQTRRKNLAMEHAITPYEDYGVMLAAIKARTDKIQAELDQLRSANAKKAMVPAIGSIRPMFETASLEWRLSVIRLLVERVVIYPSGQVKQLWEGRRFDPKSVVIEWKC